MINIARTAPNNVAVFKPDETKRIQAEADAVIDFAKKVKDWPLLERAVDKKLEDQEEFVRWWREKVTVRHGAGRGNKNIPDPISFSADDAEATTGISPQQVSKWAKRLKDPTKYRATLFGAAWKSAMGAVAGDSQLVQQSLSNEHYTPAKYVEAARAVLGGIDLDPASCVEANATVQATEFYDASTDGLRRPWAGRIWLNPPYGGLSGPFVAKLADDYAAGKVSAAVILVNAHCTDTTWFRPLWDGCLCFTDHRINFEGDKDRSGSTHGSVFAYFGPDRAAFVDAFSQFGFVVARCE